jgi:septum formation protein
MSVEEVPIHVARQKALVTKEYIQSAYHGRHASEPVLAADTIVVLDNEVINKPCDHEEAVEMLQRLSGKVHRVITGVVILANDQEISFADITEVEFHPLSEAQIRFYVNKYSPLDKAGAYAIQEWIGVVGIKSIKGDFYNVMGLPVSRVLQALQKISSDNI